MTPRPRTRWMIAFALCSRRSATWWGLLGFVVLLCAASPTAAQTITVSIANPTAVLEGDGGTTNLDFVVTRSVGAAIVSTVDFTTSNNSAVQPADYLPATGTVTFLAGEVSKIVTVQVVGETVFEGSETFFVTLSNPVNCSLGTISGVGTILNDDVSVSIGNAPSVTEGDAGTIDAVFTVSLSAPKPNLTLSVDYMASNNSAVQPSDYAPTTGTVTFLPGETSKTVTVAVNGDTDFEGNETFFVTLSNAVSCSLGTSTGVGTILNDDVSVSIGNAPALTEGDAGTIDAVFTISLSAPKPNLTLSVDYAASNNSAVQPSDYAPTTGTVTFLPGETSKTVTVAVNGDTDFEGNETFFVTLSNAVNCSLGTSTGVGTILNDDVSVSIGNAPAVTEGDAGTIDTVFTISLSAPKPNLTLSVDYAASNNSAVQPSDYAPTTGTVTFLPGETSKTVTVAVNGDTAFEGNETFFVSLSNAVNCSLGTITGVATILNDDVSVSINNAPSITEGDSGTIDAVFTISLSAPKPNLTLSVDYATSNNSAVQPSDYAPTTGTVTFLPGETSKTVTVAVNGDTAFEGNETFFVSLSNAVNCSLGTITGVGTILNDDVSVSINNAPAVTEGDGGTIDAVFTISLSAPKTNLTLTVDYAASNNSAVQPSDYAPASGTVTFLPGETSKTVNVAVNGDTAFEGNETFFVSLSNAVNCSLGTISGVATILNDDVAPKTTTWTGAISTAWSNPGNWTAGVPIAGDTALFSGTGSTDSVVDLTLGAPGLLSLQLTAGYGGTLSLAPGETLTAANLILSSGTLAAAGGTLVVDVNLSASAGALDLSSAVEVRAAGGLSVGGAVAFTPPSILRLTGASTTQALSMAGHPLQGIELAGSSATLSAVGPVVASGLLEVTGSANTLAGTFTLAALQVDPGVGLTTSSASAVTVLGPLSLAAGSTLSLGADLTAPGPISNLGLIALNGRRLIHAAESLAFTDATGTPVTDVFPGVDPVIATVIDGNLNLDGTQVESITSVVATTASGDAENFAGGLDLIETGPATGVFRSAALPTELSASAAAQDGLLQAVLGDTFALTYTDPTDPGDTAQAMLGTGSLPPRILATSPAPSSRVASTLMTASVSFDQEIDSATLTDATVFVAPLLPFTGDAFDAPSLDLAAWTPRPGPGIVQQVAGVLHIEQGGVPDGRARVDSRFAVDGDFDIEVGFVAQGLPVPSVGQNRIFMRLVNLADTAVVYQLSRFTEAGGADGFEFERTTGSDRVAQTPSSGRLRLQRQGSLLSAFVDAGSGFVPLGSPVPVIPGPFAVDLGVAAFGSGSGLVAADFDDFLVTAGRGFVPGAPIPTASLTYDSPTASVTLAYPAPLAPGPYVLLALSEPGGVILAPTGLALDGEPLGPLPSGDGTAGGTFFGLFTVNAPPTANAGLDQSVNEGGLVALDGSSSLDVDGDPLSFTWVQTGGPPVVLFAPATATPTFIAPAVAADATVSFQLTLSDGLESDTDTVAVVVHPLNQAPTASAGPDQSVNAGDAVTLDGSGSLDLDGDPLSYAWSQTAGPAVALAGASTAMPTFTAPAVAVNTTLTFQLSVSDGSAIGVDSVDILVQPLNQAPTANAGVNQTVIAGQTVELDASGSSDPDLGTTLTFTWTQLSGPRVSLIAGTTATPSFTAPAVSAPVRLDFEVSASDGSQSALDQVVVQVNPAPDWRQFRRDASHTAAGGYPGTPLGGSLFSVVTGGDVRSSVAQGPDGTLYFGSDDGSVYAFSQDGVLVGSEPTLGPVRQTPAVDAAGNVYVGSFDGMLYSFGPRLASTRWVFPSGGRFRFASPALGSGGTVVYAGSEDGSLYAVDAASGTQLWSQATGGAVYSSPAVDGAGNVYFGSNDGKVYALTSTGTTVAGWPVTLGSPVQSAPAIASNGTVLVGSDDGKLHALASDGTEVWAATTGGAITSSAAVAGTYVVVGSDDGAVRALDLADGAEMWSRPTGAQVRSSPAVSSDGTVYVGSCDGNLYALDLADGSDRFAFVLGGFVIASPAVGPDGVVYAGSDDDRLYAIGTRLFTGSLTVAPIVDTVWPAELRQGTTATVRVQGYHFREGMTLDLGAGISVGEVRLTSEQELEVGVVVEAGARLGEREAVATAARTLRGTRASALTVGFDCRRADLSGDGVVDGLDLALLASRFGAAGGEGADLTGDALVDGADLSLLAARFGGRSLECR